MPVVTPQPPCGGLYIHVPFCLRKCAYCDFPSRPFSPGDVERYLAAIEKELELRPPDFAPATVYIGGGTPTALPLPALERLLAMVRQTVPQTADIEWTCEANPGTLTAESARLLRAAGVNRLSLGAQSFDDAQLARLGRLHRADDIARAVALARAAGFDNISLDLMYALPGQSLAGWRRDLDQALSLAPEHLSLYALSIEAGTPFERERDAGRLREADEEIAREQYELARSLMRTAGFQQYEISNFARPGRECRHNLLYWSGGAYLGFGPAAHSHWRGARWGNFQGLEEWAAAVSKAWKNPGVAVARAFEERLDPAAKARETLVFGLRRLAGWRRDEFRTATGFDYRALGGDAVERLVNEGLLREDAQGLRLTEEALFISDTVFRELL